MKFKGVLLLLAAIGLSSAPVTGQATWQYTYGGYSTDEGNSVLVNTDGNFLVVGSTGSFGAGNGDIYVLLLDTTGAKIWSTTLGGPGVEQGKKGVQTPDGGYLIAGITNSIGNGGYDGYLAKIDGEGGLLWEHAYGGSDWDFLNSISNTPDGGAIVAGQTYSSGSGGGDAWVLKLDGAGAVEWERTYGGSETDFAHCIIATADGGYMLAGGYTTNTDQNAWLVKLDIAGEQQWDVQEGGDSLDYANSVIQTADGGYAVVGVTRSFSVYIEALHFKVDMVGGLQWLHNWGQINNQESLDQVELPDGRLLSVGYVNTAGSGGRDMFILFTGPDGGFLSGISNGGDNGAGDEYGSSVAIVPNGGFIFCGYTESFGYGIRDVYVVKTDSVGLTQSIAVDSYFDPLSVDPIVRIDHPLFYPNPTVGKVEIGVQFDMSSICLTDVHGQVLRTWSHPSRIIDISSFVNGTYLLRATDHDGATTTFPLVLIKP